MDQLRWEGHFLTPTYHLTILYHFHMEAVAGEIWVVWAPEHREGAMELQ